MIKKIMIYGSIVLGLIICWGIVYALIDSNKKYEISGGWDGGWPESWGWLGLKIEGRGTGIYWITGYNFSGNFIYGKTPISWFVADTQTCECTDFSTESSFYEYLRKNNIEFKKLFEVPICRIPDLPYNYRLVDYGEKKTFLQLSKERVEGNIYIINITKIGLVDDYVVGENGKGWFYLHMPTDKKQFAKSIDDLAVILGLKKAELSRIIIDVPNYAKYKLPYKNYTIGADIRIANAHGLYIKNDGSYHPAVRFLEYYREKKGYIYGKSMTDYFVFDIKNENCVYFGQKKDDWLRELNRLNLPPSGFTKIPKDDLRELKQPPWIADIKFKKYAD